MGLFRRWRQWNGVKTIYSTSDAFAALKEDGTVTAWGASSSGGSGVHVGLSGVNQDHGFLQVGVEAPELTLNISFFLSVTYTF